MDAEVFILLVDDEEPVLNALERTLRQDGYRILRANDPTRALEIVGREAIDLIISDHLMPGMKGLDFLKEVRKVRPETIRILLTGHADLEMAIQAINQGEVYRFFRKPWDDAELRMDVRIAVTQRRLERHNLELAEQVRAQANQLAELERVHPGITSVRRNRTGAIVIEDEDL
jgi:DNA-binding NtrC family response regulator